MQKLLVLIILVVFLVSACSPQNSLPPTQTNTSTLTATETVLPTATLPPATSTPSPTPTAVPVRFDRDGFRSFAILKNRYSGLSDYRQDKSYSALSTTLSPDGSKFVLSACWGSLWSNLDCDTRKSGFLIVVDIASGDVVNDIPLGSFWPGRAVISSDNQTLLFSTDEQRIILWDLKTNQEKKTLLQQDRTGNNKYPDVAISPDDKYLLAVVNGQLYVWDAEGNELTKFPVYQSVLSAGLTFNSDGTLLAVFADKRDGIMIYSTTDWTLKQKIEFTNAWSISFSANGRYVAAVDSENDLVKVWQVTNSDPVTEFQPSLYDISIQFSPKSDLLIVSGSSPLNNEDDYSLIAEVYETQTWSKLDDLHSFDDSGTVRFTRDGKKMAILSSYTIDLWGEPDASLLAGYEKIKQFQQALADADYNLAASLFTVDENQKEALIELGVDLSDLPSSLAKLCNAKTILCYPVKDLVMMGHDWDYLVYLVHLQMPDGKIYTSPKGAQIIYLYAQTGKDAQPELTFLQQDL